MDSSLLWFVRRMKDPEILSHIWSIVSEGFDYDNPCDFPNRKEDFINEIVYGSNITFINSYYELDNITPIGKEFIYDFIKKKFLKDISGYYDFWIRECDE
jgi:hypothetical protein